MTSYLRFSVPPAPAGHRLTGASLRLITTAIASAGSPDDQLIRLADDSWTESSVTHATRPAVHPAVVGTLRGPTAPATTYDIPLDPSALIGAVGSAVTLAVVGTGSNSSWFSAREAGSSKRPRLSTTFEPVPTTDTTPPSPPTGVVAVPGPSSVDLSWSAAVDDVGVTGYEVHRSSSSGFIPDATTLLGTSTTTIWTDSPVSPGTWHYRVVAGDAAGNRSTPSVSVPALVRAPATTRLVTATADTYVSSTQRTTAYGATTSLGVYGSPPVTTLLRFILPMAPANEVLTRATLRVRTTPIASAGSPDRQDVQLAGDSWDETTVTWDSRPAVDGARLGFLPGGSIPATSYDVDLAVDGLRPALGTSLTMGVQGTGTNSLWLASREATASARPTLTLAFDTEKQDNTAPGEPADLAATSEAADVSLSWTEAQDDVGVVGYDLHRSRSTGFTPTAETLMATTAAETYLDPGRGAGTWFYRVVARDAAGNRGQAAPEAGVVVIGATGSVTVAAVGDIACAAGEPATATTCRHGEVADVVRATDPDRFVALGDIQYANGTLAQFTGPGAYDAAFGTLRPLTLPVIGNHEYTDPSGPGEGYFDYFMGPGSEHGPFGARPEGFYEQTVGSWQFVALNTECLPQSNNAGQVVAGGCDESSPQYRWLDKVLSESPARCTVVAMHRPRWTTGAGHASFAALGPIWDLMVTHRVDITLSGHNHSSEVFQRIGASGLAGTPVLDTNGIRSFVAGGGGRSLYGFGSSDAAGALQARDSATFGALRLTLHEGRFDWSFVPIAGQTFTGTEGAFAGTGEACV